MFGLAKYLGVYRVHEYAKQVPIWLKPLRAPLSLSLLPHGWVALWWLHLEFVAVVVVVARGLWLPFGFSRCAVAVADKM